MIIKVRCGIDGHGQEVGRIEVDRYQVRVRYLFAVGQEAVPFVSGTLVDNVKQAESRQLKAERDARGDRHDFDTAPPDNFVTFWCPKGNHGDLKVTAAKAQEAVRQRRKDVFAERL